MTHMRVPLFPCFSPPRHRPAGQPASWPAAIELALELEAGLVTPPAWTARPAPLAPREVHLASHVAPAFLGASTSKSVRKPLVNSCLLKGFFPSDPAKKGGACGFVVVFSPQQLEAVGSIDLDRREEAVWGSYQGGFRKGRKGFRGCWGSGLSLRNRWGVFGRVPPLWVVFKGKPKGHHTMLEVPSC